MINGKYSLSWQTPHQIDLIRILTVGLERAYEGGSCGEYRLNSKRFPRISLGCMLVPVQPWEYEYRLFIYVAFYFSLRSASHTSKSEKNSTRSETKQKPPYISQISIPGC